MELISVIIPLYNSEKTLEKSIESLLGQTYPNIDIILVNDGSSDGSLEICEAFAKNNDRIQLISYTQNKGLSAALNIGLNHCRGEYIGFLDSDDWIDENMYERLYNNAKSFTADISVCAYIEERQNTQIACVLSSDSSAVLAMIPEEACHKVFEPQGFKGFLCNKLFHASFFSVAGAGIRMDESVHICMDLLCVCRCLAVAERIVYDPKPMYHYRIHDASICHSRFALKKTTLLDARVKINEEVKTHFPGVFKRADIDYLNDTVYTCVLMLHSGYQMSLINEHLKYLRKHILFYIFTKGVWLKYKLLAIVLSIHPGLAEWVWSLMRGTLTADTKDQVNN